jgi:uncharacterized membrane protein YkvA (DUF1232 family)
VALLGFLDDGIVVSTAKTTIAGNADEEDSLDGTDGDERRIDILNAEALVNTVEDLGIV